MVDLARFRIGVTDDSGSLLPRHSPVRATKLWFADYGPGSSLRLPTRPQLTLRSVFKTLLRAGMAEIGTLATVF